MVKILVAEDSLFQRRKITGILERYGFEAMAVSCAEEAIDAFQTFKPDGMLTDLHMPGMGGVALIQEIRKTNKEIPIWVLSADVQEPVVEECKELGITLFISKPLNKDKIIGALMEHGFEIKMRELG